MTNINNLKVFHQALDNLERVQEYTERAKGFGDLHNQMRRAAISVVSNIAEGAGTGNDRGFVKFLRIAKASNEELGAQALIASRLGNIARHDRLHANIDYTSRMLANLMKKLRGM